MTSPSAPARTAHEWAVERDRLNALCDAARERWNVARDEGDHPDTIAGLRHDLNDLIEARDLATSQYRYARAVALAARESAPSLDELRGNVETAAERWRTARAERDHEDTIRGLGHELADARKALAQAEAAASEAPEPRIDVPAATTSTGAPATLGEVERRIAVAERTRDNALAAGHVEAADRAWQLIDDLVEQARQLRTAESASIPEQVARLAQLDAECSALSWSRNRKGTPARVEATLAAMYDRTLTEWAELDRLRTARGELAERQAVAALCARRSR